MILSCLFNNGSDWFFAFVSALMGTLLGIGFAEIRYSYIGKKQKKLSLDNLYKTLVHVRQLLDQSKRQLTEDLKTDGIPNFTLDTSTLLNRISKSEEYISNDLWVRLNGLRYQMEHLNNKLAMLYFISMNGNQDVEGHPEFASVLKHTELVKKWIFEAILAIETEKGGA